MIIDSNAPAPLKYTDPTFQVSLFVRANIYDTSGVSPVLESTVNLSQIDNGTYWGKYTFTSGKTYLVQKLVYTDGTYTVVDQTFAQDNDDVQCINLRTANLDAAVSSRAPAATAVSNADYTVARAIKLDNLDVAVSTRLSSGAYVAPDNADIAAIKAKTDNLPTDPASNTQVNTRSTLTAVEVWSENLTPYNTDDTAGKDLKIASNGGGGFEVIVERLESVAQILNGKNGCPIDVDVLSPQVDVDVQVNEVDVEVSVEPDASC